MKVYNQSVFERWAIEDKSCQSLITSPPYYALRKYDIPDVIIGGVKDCKHEWGDTQLIEKQHHGKVLATLKDNAKISSSSCCCVHCNAWQGQHGLEPSFVSVVEYDTDEMELRNDLNKDEREFVLNELLRRNILA